MLELLVWLVLGYIGLWVIGLAAMCAGGVVIALGSAINWLNRQLVSK